MPDALWKMKKTLIDWEKLEAGRAPIANTIKLNYKKETIVRSTRWTTKTIVTQVVPYYLTETPNILNAIALAKGQTHQGAMVCRRCREVELTNLATLSHVLQCNWYDITTDVRERRRRQNVQTLVRENRLDLL